MKYKQQLLVHAILTSSALVATALLASAALTSYAIGGFTLYVGSLLIQLPLAWAFAWFVGRRIDRMMATVPQGPLGHLQQTLDDWLDGERLALKALDLDVANPEQLRHLDRRIRWLERVANTAAELDADRRGVDQSVVASHARTADAVELRARLQASAELSR